MRFIISGGWSYGNIGDEAIAKSTLCIINKMWPNADIVFTSYNPNDFYRQHNINAVDSVHRILKNSENYEISDLNKILGNLEAYKLDEYRNLFAEKTVFIMAGGGYFHENWSTQFWSRIIEIYIASMSGAKVFMIGQSIGPIVSEQYLNAFSRAIQLCDYINVRDQDTYNFISKYNSRIKLGTDTAIIISDFFKKNDKNPGITINFMLSAYTEYIGINTKQRFKSNFASKILKRVTLKSYRYNFKLKKILKNVSQIDNVHINFIMSTEWKWDQKLVDKLVTNIDTLKYSVYKNQTIDDMCIALSTGSIMISSKMHPIIISTSFGISSIAISYNYKMDNFMKSVNCEHQCYKNNEISTDKILTNVKYIIIKNGNLNYENVQILKNKVYEMFKDIDILIQ